ncbi:MAG: DUF433 domain-containing protein [Candidatus Lokiarchaeota archaeon]|nr:DUF433 domain-containing protein [Candidatus Lokiarchaeota archaeon]
MQNSKIEIDPDICHGKPRIKGTRIMIDLILEWLEAGKTFDEIIDAYPQLSREDIATAIGYARMTLEERNSTHT